MNLNDQALIVTISDGASFGRASNAKCEKGSGQMHIGPVSHRNVLPACVSKNNMYM